MLVGIIEVADYHCVRFRMRLQVLIDVIRSFYNTRGAEVKLL